MKKEKNLRRNGGNNMDRQETVTLEKFFDEKFKRIEEKIDSQSTLTNQRFDSLDEALCLAREDAKEKYEHLNKLRTDVEIDRGILVRKDTCKQMHDDLTRWKEAIGTKLTVLETRSITWTAAVGVFFLIITLVMRWYGK